jgi:hypothetical protein
MIKILLIAITVMLPSFALAEQEIVVFRGLPLVQCNSSFTESANYQLNESQQIESRLLITKKGNKHIWASRKNRELTKHQSGEITTYLEINGAGYIRVFQKDGVSLYVEHMPIALESVTFWGQADN